MNFQVIKSIDGRDEYVLLPINVYKALHNQIEQKLSKITEKNDYLPFRPEDYVDNPVALARINASITQAQLAKLMNVTQAYISKIENQDKVTAKMLNKVKLALQKATNTRHQTKEKK